MHLGLLICMGISRQQGSGLVILHQDVHQCRSPSWYLLLMQNGRRTSKTVAVGVAEQVPADTGIALKQRIEQQDGEIAALKVVLLHAHLLIT